MLPDPPGRPNSTEVLEGAQRSLRTADSSIALSAGYLSREGQGRPALVSLQLGWFRERYRDKHFDALIVLGTETLLSVMRMRDEPPRALSRPAPSIS